MVTVSADDVATIASEAGYEHTWTFRASEINAQIMLKWNEEKMIWMNVKNINGLMTVKQFCIFVGFVLQRLAAVKHQ